jgi:hypothetical protein
MKFFCIPPNKHLGIMNCGDGDFVLCHHYIEDYTYRDYFLNQRIEWKLPEGGCSRFTILDNGAAEHNLVTMSTLIDVATELKPTEVIAPDVLFNKDRTLENLDLFVSEMNKRGLDKTVNVFACPQGSTKQEWLECYQIMLDNPHVSTIGLSKIAVPKCWNNAVDDKMIALSRNQCVAELFANNMLKKPLHLLGMGEHNEFQYYLEHKIPFIRSSDSCYTILAALNGIDFTTGNIERIPTNNEYFSQSVPLDREILAMKNMRHLKSLYEEV